MDIITLSFTDKDTIAFVIANIDCLQTCTNFSWLLFQSVNILLMIIGPLLFDHDLSIRILSYTICGSTGVHILVDAICGLSCSHTQTRQISFHGGLRIWCLSWTANSSTTAQGKYNASPELSMSTSYAVTTPKFIFEGSCPDELPQILSTDLD